MGRVARRTSAWALLLLGSALLPVQAEEIAGSADVAPGLNLLGIPYPPSALSDVLLDLASAEIRRVAAYDPATGLVAYCELGASAVPVGAGCDLSIDAGRGWFAEAPFAATRVFSIDIDCPALALRPGNNIAAVPCAAPGLRAYGLLQQLGDGAAAGVRMWDTDSARWAGAGFRDGVPAGRDFPIRPGAGYVLSMRRTTTRLPPLADAGPDQGALLAAAEPVQLDAGASTDPDTPFAALRFSWTLQTPTGSQTTLTSVDTSATGFLPDLAGTYVATVAVSDGISRGTDPVRVYVLNDLAGDEDGDGIGNEEEIELGLDPFDADSDDDGWPDGVELEMGTDPLDPDSQPALALVATPAVAVIRPTDDLPDGPSSAGLIARPPAAVILPTPDDEPQLTAYRGLIGRPPASIILPTPEDEAALTRYRGLLADPPVSVELQVDATAGE